MPCFSTRIVKTSVLAAIMASYGMPTIAWADDNGASGKASADIPEASYKKLHSLQGHWDNVNDVEFSADGKYVATASDDGSFIVWETKDGSQKFDAKFDNAANVTSVTFSPDSKYIFTGLYDSEMGGKGAQFSVKKEKIDYAVSLPGVVEMDYSPDGESVLVGYLNDTTPLSIINIKRAKKKKKKGRIVHLEGHTGMNTSAEFSPDGKFAVTTSLDGNMVVWDTKSGRRKMGIKADLNDATFSPDGRYIAAAGTGVLNIHNAKDGKVIRSLIEKTDENLYKYELLFDVDFHPNGRILAAASSLGSVFFFDMKTGRVISRISNAHSDQIVSLDYNFDGSMLVTGSRDDTAAIWELK